MAREAGQHDAFTRFKPAAGSGLRFGYDHESIPHARSTWIGVLQGSWRSMGVQYGVRAGKDIAKNWDVFWQAFVLSRSSDRRSTWQSEVPEERWGDYAIGYLRRQFRELSYLSTEICALYEGVAAGAKADLDRCAFAAVGTHVDKILFLNSLFGNFFARDWVDDCNGMWVKGEATATGETYATHTKQAAMVSLGIRQIAFIGIPEDPAARVFWSADLAGRFGGGAGVMSDRGLCVLTSGAQYGDANARAAETLAPGIRDNGPLCFYSVLFANDASHAAQISTVGTPRYREITGRHTVLRARGANLLYCDADEAYCVEQNARHYAIRTPGRMGEIEGNYIVIANHFNIDDGSFDEANQWRPDKPMRDFCPITHSESTRWRFWSGMWAIKENYGKIDREMFLRELVPLHTGWDEGGNRYDPDAATGVPTVPVDRRLGGTFCDHQGEFNPEYPLGNLGGNMDTAAFALRTREVWWVPAWPCHYKDKAWNYVDLKPYSEYRRLLWGY